MSVRHKWQKHDGWDQCIECGLIREKHFGMPWMYYYDHSFGGEETTFIKAPECKDNANANR